MGSIRENKGYIESIYYKLLYRPFNFLLIFLQLSHAYQQILSAKKTLTLWGTHPAFKALLAKLQ